MNQDEQRRERLAHHIILRYHLELMLSVVEEGLRESLELDSWTEILRLVGQCSILVGIVGIVAGLIAA